MLEPGPENATSGMSQLIYQEMDRLLSPPLQTAVDGMAVRAVGPNQHEEDARL